VFNAQLKQLLPQGGRRAETENIRFGFGQHLVNVGKEGRVSALGGGGIQPFGIYIA